MKYTEIFNEDLGDNEQRRVAVVGEAFGGGPCDELQLQVQDGSNESFIDMNFEEVKALRDKLSEWLIENGIEPEAIKDNSSGVDLIAKERKRQIKDLGFDYTNDSLYAKEELAIAGAVYAMLPVINEVMIDENGKPYLWPWDIKYFKPTPEDRIKELSKAGALITAQIDYLLNIKK